MSRTISSRLSEPSTWAGVGVIANSIAALLATSGTDASAWAALFAGVIAAAKPEGK